MFFMVDSLVHGVDIAPICRSIKVDKLFFFEIEEKSHYLFMDILRALKYMDGIGALGGRVACEIERDKLNSLFGAETSKLPQRRL